MTNVIGFRQEMMKECTCRECGDIVERAPHEEKFTDRTDNGTRIGLYRRRLAGVCELHYTRCK